MKNKFKIDDIVWYENFSNRDKIFGKVVGYVVDKYGDCRYYIGISNEPVNEFHLNLVS